MTTARPGIRPFAVSVPDEDIADLRSRLGQTRWPPAETVDDWSQGVPLAYLREVCATWRDDHDWRSFEAELNALPNFLVEIDGLDIHFIEVPCSRPEAPALLLLHGWPGSVAEYLEVLGPLSEDFHVVCPSLPGYGLGEAPREPGWGGGGGSPRRSPR